MTREKLVKDWARALENGSASVFIGAGLSRRAGYPDWRKLLKDIADELNLDIAEEHDLAAVAQYSLNKATGKRTKLTKLIVDEFPYKPDAPEPFRILARLPLRHVWTTNYDKLPEAAWAEERKLLDVKSRNADLGVENPYAQAVLYKMHGTVDHPAEVVIAKDDYELYRRERPAFLQILSGQFVTRQFLFLGFSFTDPNISHLFANIREAFKENGPQHYAIVCRPKLGTGKGARKRWETDKVRHGLWVEDLQRYGIHCVEIDEFEDVDAVLSDVEIALARRSVFVSGSLPINAPNDQRERVEAISREIGRVVAESEKRLISGFGLTVGSATLAGALGVVLKQATPNLDKSLLLRPFAQEAPAGMTLENYQRQYREGMVRHAGVCVFIAGLKDLSGKVVVANGVLEEAKIAKAADRVLIPIGCSGGAAEKLWQEMKRDRILPLGLSTKDFERLNDPAAAASKIAKIVGKAISALPKS